MTKTFVKTLEEERLQTLYRYSILDTPREEAYDRITRMVARIFEVPVVLINLVDQERVWAKSSYGITHYEVKRSDSFCDYVIQEAQPLIVPDASSDLRFRSQPEIIDQSRFRFYAGVPLRSPDGYILGTLCILDTQPRNFSIDQQATLKDLAASVINQFELDFSNQKLRHIKELEEDLHETQEQLHQIIETSPEGIIITNPAGQVLFANTMAEQILELSRPAPDGPYSYPAWKITDLDDNPLPREKMPFEHVLRTGQPVYDAEHAMEHPTGKWQVVSANAAPLHKATGEISGVVISLRDITQQKWAEVERINLLKQEKAARLKAEAIQERLSNILESIADSFFTLDQNWCFSYVNQIAETLFGKRQQELLGQNIWVIFPQLVGLDFYREAIRALSENHLVHFETFFEPLQKWFATSCYPSRTGLSIYLQDITDQKEAEEKLHEVEERFRSAFNLTAIGMALQAPDGHYLQVNQALCQMLGYTEEELLQTDFQRLTYPDDLPGNLVQLQRLIEGEFSFIESEKRYLHKDGSLIWGLVTVSVVRDRQGQPFYYIVQAQNITERKKVEQDLRQSEARYRTLAKNFPNGAIILFDQDLRYLLVEGNGLSVVGLTGKDYVGKTVWEAFPPGSAETLAPHYRAALAGQEYQFEFIPNETERIYSVHTQPVKNEEGETVAGMVMAQDITDLKRATKQIQELNASLEQRVNERTVQLEATNQELATTNQELAAEIEERTRLEEELRLALQKAQEVNELKSRFVSMTSHEFRTPLSTIQANAELLQRYGSRWSEEKKKELFNRITDSTQHMTHMLEDVLLIGKAEAGKVDFRPVPLNLADFCCTLIEEVEIGLGANHELFFVQHCEDFIALLDEKLMRQIIGNLLSNAAKYSPIGKPIYMELDCQNDQAVLIVRDKGIGIPPEDLPHLFEVFHRAKNAGNVQGTGLGLAIVKLSVELHHGTLSVESQVGVGTSFTVRLPINI